MTPNSPPGGPEGGPTDDPIRVVLDSRLRLPLTSRLLHLDSAAPTWVASTSQAPRSDPRP